MKKNQFLKSVLSTLILAAALFAAGFYNTAAAEDKESKVSLRMPEIPDMNFPELFKETDKIKSHSFTLGDSVLEMLVSPLNTAFVETYDSAGNGVDTFKVYLVSPSGDEKLAELKGMNRGSDSAVYSTGIIINGDGGSSVWKVLFDYPYKIKMVRTNVSSLSTKVSKGSIRATKDGTGSLNDMLDKFATLNKPGWKIFDFRQPLKL